MWLVEAERANVRDYFDSVEDKSQLVSVGVHIHTVSFYVCVCVLARVCVYLTACV